MNKTSFNKFFSSSKTLGLVLITIIFITAFYSWFRFFHIPVTVNQKKVYISYGQTVKHAISKLNINNKSGSLYSINGEIIKKNGGYATKIYMDGKKVDLNSKIFSSVKIETFSGRDKKEPVKTIFKTDNPEPIITGVGPFVRMERDSFPSVTLVKTGKISGAVEKIKLFEGFPALYQKTNGKNEKICALTFDDGPSIYTPYILDILKKHGVKATFFMIGLHIEKHPNIARKVSKEGHTIGNHSYSHPPMGKLTSRQIEKEINISNKVIKKATGVKPRWFRPPMRSLSSVLYKTLNNLELNLVLWDVDPSDWKVNNPNLIYRNIIENVKPGSVILMHDGGGNRTATVNSLSSIIRTLQNKGYVFVTLDGYKKIQEDRKPKKSQ